MVDWQTGGLVAAHRRRKLVVGLDHTLPKEFLELRVGRAKLDDDTSEQDFDECGLVNEMLFLPVRDETVERHQRPHNRRIRSKMQLGEVDKVVDQAARIIGPGIFVTSEKSRPKRKKAEAEAVKRSVIRDYLRIVRLTSRVSRLFTPSRDLGVVWAFIGKARALGI